MGNQREVMSQESIKDRPPVRGYLHEDYRFFHNRDEKGAMIDMHYHEFYKLIVILSGRGSYLIEGENYELEDGDVIFVGRNMPHKPAFEPGQLYDRYTFFLSASLLQHFSGAHSSLFDVFANPAGPVFRPGRSGRERIRLFCAQLEQEYARKTYGADVLSGILLIQLLIELERQRQQSGRAVPAVRSREDQILPILRYIDTHLTEDLGIERLSELFFLSPYHMMRRFKEVAGQSVHEYVSERRLLAARSLLQRGETATRACYACGFTSYSAFARAYAKKFGASPRKDGKEADEISFETDYDE